jgi:hypothetical protein
MTMLGSMHSKLLNESGNVPNPAGAGDTSMMTGVHLWVHRRGASGVRRHCAIRKCRNLSIVLLAALALSGCAHRPATKAEPKISVSQLTPGQTETASLVGTWTTALPDEPEQTARVELGADEHWSLWPPGRPEYVDPKKPSQAGTWFIRNGKVFFLVEQSESDKIIPGMAFAFDIKSVSSDRAVVFWGGREMRCCKIR